MRFAWYEGRILARSRASSGDVPVGGGRERRPCDGASSPRLGANSVSPAGTMARTARVTSISRGHAELSLCAALPAAARAISLLASLTRRIGKCRGGAPRGERPVQGARTLLAKASRAARNGTRCGSTRTARLSALPPPRSWAGSFTAHARSGRGADGRAVKLHAIILDAAFSLPPRRAGARRGRRKGRIAERRSAPQGPVRT